MTPLVLLMFVLAVANPEADPRRTLVQLQLEDRTQEALQLTRRELREHPERARQLGLDYLAGHLLERLERHEQAADAFAQAMAADSRLALHSRYRAALKHEEMGHPETAAGLVASVVSSSQVSEPLLGLAVKLLTRTVARGGDCRVLRRVDASRLDRTEGRYVRLIRGDCSLRAGTRESQSAARAIYLDLLREDAQDEPQREAAERLAALIPARAASLDPRNPGQSEAALIGMAFFQHRDFENALRYLSRTSMIFGRSLDEAELELAYAQARSLFWQERFDEAAHRYQWIAMQTSDFEAQARVYYQQARSLELAGRWRQALESFRAAYRADPAGPWADAALFSHLRLLWNGEQEDEAGKLYEMLRSKRSWRETAARAALFLAASDLVRGRADRAGAWLDQAARVTDARLESDYWKGRLAELEDRPEDAVEAYLAVLRRDLFHPLAARSRARLEQPRLAAVVRPRGIADSRTDENDRLYEARLLLGSEHPLGQAALDHLRRHLASDRTTAAFLDLHPLPVERWPLWRSSQRRSEDLLLALGDLTLSRHLVDDHFPLNDLELAVTGSNLLAITGNTRDSIRMAEVLAQRIPASLPEPLLPSSFRRLLYPLAHREVLIREGRRWGVDPLLLASIIREESRFDENALSAASARGLTQFVQPTARRIALRIGIRRLAPQDLYRPAVAIPLGAAYLQELFERFAGRPEMVVAAYNAGEPQAQLWSRYCFSSEPEEYITKVGFRQTRDYVTHVLGSLARYQDLYAPLEDLEPAASAYLTPAH